MLLNNFKPLLYFGGNGSFVNVLGNKVNLTAFLTSAGRDTNAVNGYSVKGAARAFNYNSTTGSNSYVNEQTSYDWKGVTKSTAGSTGISDEYTWSNGFVLFIGTGDTTVTADDYKLDTPVSLAVTAASCIHNTDGTTAITRTFQNNTENDVTIKELGLYVYCSYSSKKPIVMIGRKVLSTPVTIPVGASYTFSWTINLVKDLQFTED